jgi:hypothetical protein
MSSRFHVVMFRRRKKHFSALGRRVTFYVYVHNVCTRKSHVPGRVAARDFDISIITADAANGEFRFFVV